MTDRIDPRAVLTDMVPRTPDEYRLLAALRVALEEQDSLRSDLALLGEMTTDSPIPTVATPEGEAALTAVNEYIGRRFGRLVRERDAARKVMLEQQEELRSAVAHYRGIVECDVSDAREEFRGALVIARSMISQLERERDELRATLANERGEGPPPSTSS